MKHRFWVEGFWGDLGHCKCCPCEEGVYPIGAEMTLFTEAYEKRQLEYGHFCRYGKDCKAFGSAQLFIEQLKGQFVARTEEDYEPWIRYRQGYSSEWDHRRKHHNKETRVTTLFNTDPETGGIPLDEHIRRFKEDGY